MKTIINLFKPIIKDRKMLSLLFAIFLIGIIFFITMILNSEASESLIYSRYTVFGSAHLYKESWTYRIFLGIFGPIVSFIHTVIIAKIYKVSSRRNAIIFAFLSIIVIIIGIVTIINSIHEIPN